MAQSCFASSIAGIANEVVRRSAIFFDRDGVLTIPTFRDGRSYAALSLEEFHIYPEAFDAVQLAKKAGLLAIVVTNQPDVASGKVSRTVVEKMHQTLRDLLAVDDIEVSFDPSGSDAPRRKPNPGMIFDAAEKWSISLASSFVIGDRASDLEAATRAGCRSVFIDRGYVADSTPLTYDYKAVDVLDAVMWCITPGGVLQNAESV